jgi:hypothetical protein
MSGGRDSSIRITGHDIEVGAIATGDGASATSGDSVTGGTRADDAPSPASAQPEPSASPRRSMPPYRAIFVVDAERSSDCNDPQMVQLSRDIVRVLENAFARAGMGEAWRGRRFQMQAHRGDGYVVGLPAETLPDLLHPFLHVLQEELQRLDRTRLAWHARLRMRASIHLGPLPDGEGWTDGVGKPMVETHRLLDSDEVRRLLSGTNPEVTFLAVIVSRRVFEDVVVAGFCDLHPQEFTPVTATAKRFAETAYLYLPKHSTDRPATPGGPCGAHGGG